MDVRFNPIHAVDPVKKYQSAQRAQRAVSTAAQAMDEVNVSPNGKIFSAAMRQLAATPDVREDKVAELRGRIQSGTYAPSSRDIAAKMLGTMRIAKDF
ncbi:MAG: flagellar biosynthesis anti-sigma factor FlgM [Oscillospiraceae bacterium]|nr:flagellar biosynthesis anti-sigma factor FlgM [Oscillospiraceae bacterium]